MDAQTLIQTMTIQFGYTEFVFTANLKGISEEDGLKQPVPGGNCLNWVAGHIVGSRGSTLELLGQERSFAKDKYARYERGSDAVVIGEGTVPLAEILADFLATADGLKIGLAGLTRERLGEKAPFSPANNPEETVGSLLVGLAFHESYHCGQLGVLRRMAGAEGAIN
jgi:hypothetical protein